MLSALITHEHSYPAVPLAGQLAHQRFALPGPLVTYSLITKSVDYIFNHRKSDFSSLISDIRWLPAYYGYEFHNHPSFDKLRISRYGVITNFIKGAKHFQSKHTKNFFLQ